MTRSYFVNGVAMADGTTLIKGRSDGLDSAADGSVASATVIIRDPQGAQAFVPWCEFAVEDDACSSPRSWTGYLANMQISRGEYSVGVTPGSPRSWSFDLFDLNSLLHRQVLRNLAANNRKRESGSARMAWLLASEALAGLVYDNGLVASNEWMFDEADYRGRFADDVLADISVSSIDDALGELSFVYWDDQAAAGEERSLFYHGPTAVIGTSSITLSNVDADVNNTTCFWVHPDPVLDRQGEDIYCGVWFTTKNGSIYRHSATTHAAYFANTNIHRDGTFSTDRISLGATADAHALRWLANHSGTVDVLKVTARLTPAVVNLLNAGMRTTVRLPHLPGYGSATYTRVRRRTLPIEEGKRLWYDVPLELSLKGVPVSGGGSPGSFPYQPQPGQAHWYEATILLAGDNAPGAVDQRTYAAFQPGWLPNQAYNYQAVAENSVIGLAGAAGTTQVSWGILPDSDFAHSPSNEIAFLGPLLGDYVYPSDTVSGSFTTGPSILGTQHLHAQVNDAGHNGGDYARLHVWVDPAGWVAIPGGSPSPAQPVPPEVVTMSGPNGRTANPFAAGSLHVYVDNTDQTGAIIYQDGTCGDFTLGFTPKPGEVVTVTYQGL